MSNGVGPVSGEANIQNIDPQFNNDSGSSGLSYEEVAALHAAVAEEGTQTRRRATRALQSIVDSSQDEISSNGVHSGLNIQPASSSSSVSQVDWTDLDVSTADYHGLNQDISTSMANNGIN